MGSVFVATILAYALYVAMNPGGMNNDTYFHLDQAERRVPFNDWHPVILTLIWQKLIDLTGKVSSMLFVQMIGAWACAILTSYYLLKVTRRGWSSLAGLFILYMPNTVNMIGVLTKDTHLGIAMYFAVILMLLLRVTPRLRWLLVSLAFVSLIYAGLVRKNSAVAVVPVVIVFTLWLMNKQKGKRGGELKTRLSLRTIAVACVASVVGFGVVLVGVGAGITAITKPTTNSQYTQVLIDDLVFAIPQKAIDAADAPQAEKERLRNAKDSCEEQNRKAPETGKPVRIWDAYWVCYGKGKDGPFTEVDDPAAVRTIWLQTVPQHFGNYVQYRIKTTSVFLFTSQPKLMLDGKAERSGYKTMAPRMRDAVTVYANDFGVKTLPWIYLGAVALGLSMFGIVRSLRKKSLSLWACAIFSSGILYIMTYFPTAPASDYRYIFWSWLATMLGWLVLWADRQRRRNPRIR